MDDRRAIGVGYGDSDTSHDLVLAMRKGSKHHRSISWVRRLTEDRTIADKGRIGCEDNTARCRRCGSFLTGKTLNVGISRFAGYRRLVDVGGLHDGVHVESGQKLPASGRSGSQDEFEVVHVEILAEPAPGATSVTDVRRSLRTT